VFGGQRIFTIIYLLIHLFSIHVIENTRINNLKLNTILLSLLFVYDVFFVFITPYFTSVSFLFEHLKLFPLSIDLYAIVF